MAGEFYNPMPNFQQRYLPPQTYNNILNRSGYPNYLPQQDFQNTQWTGLRGRPVTGIEEVRGTIVDNDGSLFIFPDLGHRKIYTKQVSYNGEPIINCYSLAEIPETQKNIESEIDLKDYVKIEEVNKIVNNLNLEIGNLKLQIQKLMENTENNINTPKIEKERKTENINNNQSIVNF